MMALEGTYGYKIHISNIAPNEYLTNVLIMGTFFRSLILYLKCKGRHEIFSAVVGHDAVST